MPILFLSVITTIQSLPDTDNTACCRDIAQMAIKYSQNRKAQQNLQPTMDHNQDNDTYSEEQGRAEKKTKIRPLHLTEKELKQRLVTLKNYSIWKKTKAKRINCKELVGDQASPIIHTVASYGSRYGKNQVFIEFIQNEEQTSVKSEEASQRFETQKGRDRKKSITKDRPSFISYKADEKEKEKIYKMISLLPNKQGNLINISKRRSSTQPRLSQRQTQRKASPYPRELAKLKKKLRILPSLVQRNKTEPAEINPQEQNPTISFASKQSQPIRLQTQGRYSKQANSPFIYDDSENNRSNYLKNIHKILNKSSELLNGCIPEPDIRVSNSSFNSLYRSKRCQSQSLPAENKQRYLSYWPKYAKYCIKDADEAKFKQILKKCQQINGEGVSQNQDMNEMISIIKGQISLQQDQINNQILMEQKNAFQHKFDYKISLEREKYKRNMKELLRCKKEYRIEKQREEIRANGIKRLKKMGGTELKKNKMKVEDKEED